MQTLAKMDCEILNATADDWENLEQILAMIGACPGNLQRTADSIRTLVESSLLDARLEDGTFVTPNSSDLTYVWRAWFHMPAPKGKKVLQESGLNLTTADGLTDAAKKAVAAAK